MNNSENNKTNINELNIQERIIADKVANEILRKEKKEKKAVLFFLLLFILLVFVLSYLIFSRFALYSKSEENGIQSGSVVFSYEEGTNRIDIKNAGSTPDEVGKNLSGSEDYFEFDVAIKIYSKKKPEITYEISLTQNLGTLDSKYVRILLTENGKEVPINGDVINNFNSLPDSTIRKGSKVLYKNVVQDEALAHYVFKMWISEDYQLDNISRTFSCFVNIDAY